MEWPKTRDGTKEGKGPILSLAFFWSALLLDLSKDLLARTLNWGKCVINDQPLVYSRSCCRFSWRGGKLSMSVLTSFFIAVSCLTQLYLSEADA